jgi:hypothetical protein
MGKSFEKSFIIREPNHLQDLTAHQVEDRCFICTEEGHRASLLVAPLEAVNGTERKSLISPFLHPMTAVTGNKEM